MAVIGDSFMAKLLDEAYELLKDEVVLLSGAASEIERLQDTFRSLQLVLADADRKKIEDGAVKKWLMDLKDVMYDADDVLDECRVKAERHKKLSSASTRFSPRPYFHKIVWGYQIKRRIQNLNARLSEIGDERSKFGLSTEFRARASPPQISRKTSHLADPDIVGSAIEEDTNKLVELMINDGQNEDLVVHSVVGIGGIGKTTIARSIHNDERITAHFKIKIWLSITKDFTDVDLLSSVARMLFKQYPMYHQTDLISQNASRDCLEPAINRIVRGRRFFIVLDDLWSEEVWYDLLRNPLQGGAAGSCILITTRNVGIAEKIDAINIHMMQPMSSVDGWALLRKKVTSIGEEDDVKALEDIGLEIVKKCGGLPLAIRAIGGVLRNKKKRRSEWEDTLQNANWSVNWLPEGVHAALYLSYEDLPSHLKECFLHVCLFPLAPFFHKHDLIQYWIAEGFIKGQ